MAEGFYPIVRILGGGLKQVHFSFSELSHRGFGGQVVSALAFHL
jgi:hypothetical protein